MASVSFGIPCPACGSGKSRVKKRYNQRGYIRRRRECSACGERFTTCEKLPNSAPPEQVDKGIVATHLRGLIADCRLEDHM